VEKNMVFEYSKQPEQILDVSLKTSNSTALMKNKNGRPDPKTRRANKLKVTMVLQIGDKFFLPNSSLSYPSINIFNDLKKIRLKLKYS